MPVEWGVRGDFSAKVDGVPGDDGGRSGVYGFCAKVPQNQSYPHVFRASADNCRVLWLAHVATFVRFDSLIDVA